MYAALKGLCMPLQLRRTCRRMLRRCKQDSQPSVETVCANAWVDKAGYLSALAVSAVFPRQADGGMGG